MSNEAWRRFPARWSVVEVAEAFVAVDADETLLTFVYFDEAERGANSTRWMKPEARQMAVAIAETAVIALIRPRRTRTGA